MVYSILVSLEWPFIRGCGTGAGMGLTIEFQLGVLEAGWFIYITARNASYCRILQHTLKVIHCTECIFFFNLLYTTHVVECVGILTRLFQSAQF